MKVKVKKLSKRRHGKGRTRRNKLVRPRTPQVSTGPSRAMCTINRALDISVLGLPTNVEAKLKMTLGSTLADLTRRTRKQIHALIGSFVGDLEDTLEAKFGLHLAEGR